MFSISVLSSVIPIACSIMDCKGEVYGVSCLFLRKPGGPHSLFSFPEMFTFTLDVDRHYHILNVSSFLLLLLLFFL